MTREEWLNAFSKAAAPQFETAGVPLHDKIRISIGFPSGGRRAKSIGECFYGIASVDGCNEIFIHPTLGDSSRVADVLTHELIHAALPSGVGHKRPFAKAARALGLEGKPKATTAGPDWHAWADPLLEALGPIPHASLDASQSTKKKQGTRMLKCTCDNPDCQFTFRTTAKWVAFACAPSEEALEDGEDEPRAMRCPVDGCDGLVTAEQPDEPED